MEAEVFMSDEILADCGPIAGLPEAVCEVLKVGCCVFLASDFKNIEIHGDPRYEYGPVAIVSLPESVTQYFLDIMDGVIGRQPIRFKIDVPDYFLAYQKTA